MTLRRLLAVGIAALLVTAGAAAAAPGTTTTTPSASNATAGHGPQTPAGDNADRGQSDDDATDPGNEADRAAEADRGPPIEMPDPVPDRVSEIHSLVDDYLDGDLSVGLGQAISDLLGGPVAGNQPANTTPGAGNQPADTPPSTADS